MLPTAFLQKVSPIKTIFPYHHIVSDERLPHIANLYPYKNIRDFTKDLDYLLKVCKPIEPDILAEYIWSNKLLPDKSFLLTFDDGFREVADIIAPILFRKGVPAIFFINPAVIDNKKLLYRNKISLIIEVLRNNKILQNEVAGFFGIQNKFDEETLYRFLKQLTQHDMEFVEQISNHVEIDEDMYLKLHQPYLSEDQVKSLSARGFRFGGHSWDHPYYKLLDEQDQIEQTLLSCNYINTLIEQKKMYFSFPHEDNPVKQSFFEKINTLVKIDLFFGIQNHKFEMQNSVLHRMNAERPWLNMKQIINGAIIYSAGSVLLNRNKVVRY